MYLLSCLQLSSAQALVMCGGRRLQVLRISVQGHWISVARIFCNLACKRTASGLSASLSYE